MKGVWLARNVYVQLQVAKACCSQKLEINNMHSNNYLPNSWMTVCIGLQASISTLVNDSFLLYTPYSTKYATMTPLGSFGGFQVMLTEVSVHAM